MTKDIIAILVILAGLVSFFWNPIGGDSIKYLQILAGTVIGIYIGIKEIPLQAAAQGVIKRIKK